MTVALQFYDVPSGLSSGDMARRGRRKTVKTPRVVRKPGVVCDGAGMARIRLSIVFESGARIGPGKATLLESIRDTGSISAAARDMGMSYKRAWLLLDSMNQAFIEPVVTAAPGGAGGGGASLTPFGAEVLDRYRRIYDRAAAVAVDDLTALGRRARPEAGPKI
jgi:molybdate transport system regulatory protein